MTHARRLLPILLATLALAGAAPCAGQDADDAFEQFRTSLMTTNQSLAESVPPPIDPAASINESNAFLKEREPEMNAEEYALYEKVVALTETNPVLAVRILEGMVKEKSNPSPAFEFILGNVYYAAGRHAEAETRYKNAVMRYPTFLRAWINLGVLQYTAGRYADAMACFSRAIVLGDREPTTFGLLGYCLEQDGNAVSAEMAYMQALAGDPANTGWKEGLLRIYLKGRQLERAESLVRTLIKAAPGDARFWLAYAKLLAADRRKLQAAAILEVAAQAGTVDPEGLALLGDLYAEQGLVTEAIAAYRRLGVPQEALGEQKLLHFAQSLVTSGQAAEALSVLESLPENPSSDGRLRALQIRADVHAARKQWPEARALLEEIIRLAPMNGRAWLALGAAHAATHDTVRATLAFETALEMPDAAYRAHLELANIELQQRHYAKGAAHLEDALRIQNTDAVRHTLARIQTLILDSTEAAP